MAFIANLTEQEQLRLYDAVQSHVARPVQPVEAAILPNAPPPAVPLRPSLINSTMQENAVVRVNGMIRDGVDGIVETPGTGSGYVYWRNDRHFFLRYNDGVYMVSTNGDLSEIYEVQRQMLA